MSKIKNKQILIVSDFDINNKKLINVSDPINSTDAATKNYVDTVTSGITGGVSSLQVAYNNSTSIEILTNETNGAVSIKRGSASDNDNVFEILNGINTTTATIKGDGTISTTNLLASGATIHGDVSIYGNFFISGTTTTVDVDNVVIKDNILLLNNGEIGNGVSLIYSGIEIERGSATNYQIVFNENDDKLYVGLVGSLNPIGTVSSVGGTGTVSGLSLSGTVTTTGNLTLGGTLAVTASNFASQTANTVLIAPDGSNGVPTFRVLSANDIPSLSWNKITSDKPTTLSGYGITDAQPLDGDLTAIAALSGTSGTLKKTAVNTWILDTATSGGHTIRSNGTDLTTRTGLNFITNGIGTAIATDDSGGNETEINIRLNSLVDVNPTGVIDGSVWKYDGTTSKTVPIATTPFAEILHFIETNLSTAGLISTYLYADYSLMGIRVKGNGTTTAGTLLIGSTVSGSDIGSIVLTTTIDTYIVIKKRWFSKTLDTDLYISGLSAGTVELEFNMVKGIISEPDVTLRNYVSPTVSTGVLTFDFANKQECFATKSGGGAIVVNTGITIAYSNTINFKSLWTAIEVQTSSVTITFPVNHKSSDTRWSSLVLTLDVGFYQLSVIYNGSYYHVSCSQPEV